MTDMSMFGGMLSFEVKDGHDAAMSVAVENENLSFARRVWAGWKA